MLISHQLRARTCDHDDVPSVETLLPDKQILCPELVSGAPRLIRFTNESALFIGQPIRISEQRRTRLTIDEQDRSADGAGNLMLIQPAESLVAEFAMHNDGARQDLSLQ